MSIKTKSISALFVALVVVLAISPQFINNMYSTILGRVFMIGVVIFFAMNNTTLGLLAALVIITASNQFGPLVEGMENDTPVTVGDDNTDVSGGQKVLTASAVDAAKKKLSDLKQAVADQTMGVDLQSLKDVTMPKDSNSIPVDKNMNNSTEVSPSSSDMLNSKLNEGFASYAAF
jgi:hypothetical protein